MIRYFAAHPTSANLLMILLIAAGLLAVPTLQRETFPDFDPRQVSIDVEYRGASAEDIEEAVCQRIGDALEGLMDLHEIRCEAREGMASAVAEMQEGGDFRRFLDDVKTEVEAIDEFPDAAEDPIIQELGRTDFVASLAITGPPSASQLKAYAEDLKDRLLRLPEVSQLDLKGFSDRQLYVAIPKLTLRQLGLSAQDIAAAVARQSLDMPAGIVETRTQDVLIRFAEQRQTPRELESLVVVSGQSGAEIRLGEIATITDRFEQEEEKILFQGRRAAVLEIRKTQGEDSLQVIAAVRRFVEAEKQRVPIGVELALSQDVSSIVQDRLTMLMENGLQGFILVFLAMWLFFHGRFAFWVVLGLPVSFLGTLFVMAAIGYSLNMITMVGLLLAIGLLMDDAIVLSENIAAHLQKGKNALDAVIDGVVQVAPGVLSSFITTVAVFGPLAFLSGDIGQVLRVMPVVLIATLAISLVEAFLILPHHLVHPVQHLAAGEPSRFRRGFDRRFAWIRDNILGRTVDWVVSWRYLFLGLLLFALLATVGVVAGGKIQFEALPDIEGDVVEARLLLPQGTPLAKTEAIAEQLVAALERVDAELTPRQPESEKLVKSIQVRFGQNATASERGAHVATVVVDLLTAERRTVSLDELYARWRAEIGVLPDVISLNLQEPLLGPQGRAIEIRLHGDNLQTLQAASLELQDWLRSYRGVHDLLDDLRPGKPERRLRLRKGATVLGLSAEEVAAQLRSAFLGQIAMEIQVGPEAYEIEISQPESDRDSLAHLENFTITLPDGKQVPLGVVAEIEPARGWARIVRINGRRTVTIQSDVDGQVNNAMAIVQDTQARFLPRLREKYPTVQVAIQGQSQEAATTGQSIRRGFMLGLLGIFLVLSFQFRNYTEPLVVMVAIPFALVGALWGHIIMGYDISMPSLVGAVSLAGIVVNDSILLVHFIKLHARRGNPATEAATLASRDRFRAVLLTSLTTILGLLPLLAETSVQAQVLKPLVISVVFGLLATTFLVLVGIPCLYSILDDLQLTRVSEASNRPRTVST